VSATWATFLFEAANFLLLAAVLGWLFFRPIRAALERRRGELADEQRAAVDARSRAEHVLEEARARRSELEESLAELRERTQREAEAERDRLVESARAQMQRERDTLKQELLAQRRTQGRSLVTDAAFAVKEIVERLLGQIAGPDLERSLLGAASRQLEELRRAGPLTPVVIESASPLSEAAVAALAEAAGVAPSGVARRVDPELVVGLRVVTARGLVDVSAAGLAAQAEGALLSQLDREGAGDE